MEVEKWANHKAGFVNIIGKPNAGKSTLMNALVGERLAIITSKAQTTRHRITGIVNGDDFQIVYSDTPGIITPQYKMQAAMMGFVKTSFIDADVLVVLIDLTDNSDDIEVYADELKKVEIPIVVVLNKCDVVKEQFTEEKINYWKKKVKANDFLAVSALEKINLDLLLSTIMKHLPYSPPYYDKDELTDRPERFFISEIIREKILLNYKQEIPYSVEIVIEAFQDEPAIVRISAIIMVNRKSQKPILIGKGGSKLKKVGMESRLDIEKFLGKKVFLELFVKVKENWRDNDILLKNLGYRH